MKILKFSALVLGAAALVTSFNSCEKDDDNGIECCTYSYVNDGTRYSYRACEDGTVKVTYSGNTYTYDWRDDYGSWAEIRAEWLDEGATCD